MILPEVRVIRVEHKGETAWSFMIAATPGGWLAMAVAAVLLWWAL